MTYLSLKQFLTLISSMVFLLYTPLSHGAPSCVDFFEPGKYEAMASELQSLLDQAENPLLVEREGRLAHVEQLIALWTPDNIQLADRFIVAFGADEHKNYPVVRDLIGVLMTINFAERAEYGVDLTSTAVRVVLENIDTFFDPYRPWLESIPFMYTITTSLGFINQEWLNNVYGAVLQAHRDLADGGPLALLSYIGTDLQGGTVRTPENIRENDITTIASEKFHRLKELNTENSLEVAELYLASLLSQGIDLLKSPSASPSTWDQTIFALYKAISTYNQLHFQSKSIKGNELFELEVLLVNLFTGDLPHHPLHLALSTSNATPNSQRSLTFRRWGLTHEGLFVKSEVSPNQRIIEILEEQIQTRFGYYRNLGE